MKSILKILFIIIWLPIPFSSTAQENLDTLLQIAARNNPDLKSKFNKYMADLQKAPQIGSLPDPDITFGFFIKPMELMEGNQLGQIQFMQMFPWFGTLKASKDEASAMALSSFELFMAEKEVIFYTVRTNYYQLYLNQKQIQVYDTTLVLLRSIEQLLLTRLKTINTGSTNPQSNGSQMPNNSDQRNNSMNGNQNNQQVKTSMNNPTMAGSSTVFSDLLRLQIEIKELEDNIAFMKDQKQMLIIQLNMYLNRLPKSEIYVPTSLEIPAFDYLNPALFDSIKVNNPMMKMNKADILAAQKGVQMKKKMSYPMVGLGINYMLINKNPMNTSEMNGKDMVMPMITMKLPIYRKKYSASIKEAELLENLANEQLNNTENMLYMEYLGYQFALKDAERKLSLYQDVVSLTQKSFDLLSVQYASSGADFDALIRSYRQLLDYKLNITQVQVDKLSAIAGMQKLLSKN